MKRSESRAINGVKTAELEVMPWKNSINGPLPASRAFKVMRPVSMRREPNWSEAIPAAMFMILTVTARLGQKDHTARRTSSRLSDILAIFRFDNLAIFHGVTYAG
ncbi:hypothetical protein [Mesorhizobium sp. BR-1-1-10]|uniref:hypothetical protein n=1 Tax=Mesorhizobium sp. BR-1-1-10 TaxID=2876660 RepID=UPI001CD0E3DF|nr:hypothetical protein [Mesorhizobium sp. BR-1-1-10]MBZ9979030.1 hypothetical protein [Mesorhizobium sp. BR-1-1-10]